nr:hypothetical protein [Tanacetum cinerariifolium]
NNNGDDAFDGKEPDFDARKEQDSPNSTNTFSDVGPSNAVASPTYEKYSFINASQLPDDHDMQELKDIAYSDDEDDVSVEADFNNLETSITEEPKRVHQALKDPSWIEATQEELLQFKMQKMISGIKRMKVALWSGTKQDLSHKDTHRRRELTMKKSLLQ